MDTFEPPKYITSLIAAVNDGAKSAQTGARCQPVDRQPRRRVGMQSAQVQVDLLCLCDEGRYT
jgi:hypothetical protein